MKDSLTKDVQLGVATAPALAEEILKSIQSGKEKATELGQKAVDAIDAKREPVAAAMDKTADALHQAADTASGVTHATGDKIQKNANYIRETNVKGMMNDVQDVVKRHPAASIAVAAAAGILFGLTLRSRD